MSTQTQPGLTTPTPSIVEPRRPRRHRGRAAAAIVAAAALGVGLTALVLGVTDGSDAQVPPSPGVAPVVVDDATMQGVDRRLYNLAEEYAAQRRKQMQLAPGTDRRLYDLAEQHAAQRRERMQLERGADLRLYNLAGE